MPRANTDILLTLGAVALWSTVATAFKLALEQFTPLQLATLASAFATLLFVLLGLASGRLEGTSFATFKAGGGLWRAIGLGLLNPLAYYLVLFEAYALLPAQIAQPLNYTWSITLALLAIPMLGQIPTRRRLLGILISYLGVLVILNPWSLGSAPALSIVGVVLALFSTLIWASYWLLNARTADPITTMAVGFGCATAILIVACYWLEAPPLVTNAGLFYALWIGLIEMGFAFLLWQAALRRTKRAALLGQLIYLSPFVSLWLIQNVLGEPVRATSIAGLAIIVAGLLWGARPSTAKLRANSVNLAP